MIKEQQRDWEKIVSESNGNLVFFPESVHNEAEGWKKDRETYNKLVGEMAEKEICLNAKFNNLMLDIRKHLAANGHEDVWLKDVGVDLDALDDGKFIASIYSQTQNRIPKA